MITSRLDPVTLNDVTDLDTAPCVIEGEGSGALMIHFESEQNKPASLDTPMHGAEGAWRRTQDDPRPHCGQPDHRVQQLGKHA